MSAKSVLVAMWSILACMVPATASQPARETSPAKLQDGTEVVVVQRKDGRRDTVTVTVENAEPTIPYGGRKIGKGNQLRVDANDFPTLAKTGLHSVDELNRTKKITGRPVEAITALGRPGSSSGEGFLAADEDILSVLKGDNELVRRLGLTHPDMARPLFHVWNLILSQYGRRPFGRKWDDIPYFLYNGREIHIGPVHPTRGFQDSIFDDEITGAFEINFFREPDKSEKAFLREKYPALGNERMAELVQRLSQIHMGEMEPYYVMRYGFYEGHTSYRVDPITIAFMFGLRSLEEIEAAFPGALYETLTTHFTAQPAPADR
jgi:hypothetical protein